MFSPHCLHFDQEQRHFHNIIVLQTAAEVDFFFNYMSSIYTKSTIILKWLEINSLLNYISVEVRMVCSPHNNFCVISFHQKSHK